ncbi:TetR/AcrR family transcriptional regulator [Agromyces soli]
MGGGIRRYNSRMSSSTSTRRDARRNHERLLVEARRLFAERGIDAPLDELANRAGVGAGTVYRHFPNREALLLELYDSALVMFRDMQPEILEANTAWQAIERYIERLAGWIAETPYLAALLHRVGEIYPDHQPALAMEPLLNELVDRAKAEGSLRADVTGVDLSVLANMLGSVGQFGGGYLPHWHRQLTIVLDGLRARPELTPLPGEAPSFAEFHELQHGRGSAE